MRKQVWYGSICTCTPTQNNPQSPQKKTHNKEGGRRKMENGRSFKQRHEEDRDDEMDGEGRGGGRRKKGGR